MEFLILDHGIFPLGGNQLVLPREPEGVIGSFCLLCKGVYFGRFGYGVPLPLITSALLPNGCFIPGPCGARPTLGPGEQSLCRRCSPWGRKESDTTERPN